MTAPAPWWRTFLFALADWFTRAGDRVMFGPPDPPPGPVTPQRWERLVATGAVVEHEDERPA